MSMVGIVIEVGITLDTESRAIVSTQRLERQINYHLVAENGLEVDKLALQPVSQVIIWFDARVEVQLLDVDLQLARDGIQAPHALSTEFDRSCAGD
jgi:hypothetical protein